MPSVRRLDAGVFVVTVARANVDETKQRRIRDYGAAKTSQLLGPLFILFIHMMQIHLGLDRQVSPRQITNRA